jgi:hypothetical protein
MIALTHPYGQEVAYAEQCIIDAAGWVVRSYRATGGYTVGLSVNLRSLALALDAWEAAMHKARLDSDTNGFDRSAAWPGEGVSNEQSGQSSEAQAQRRRCAGAKSKRAVQALKA